MAGLVGYASSDEGSDIEEQNLPQGQSVVSQPVQDCSKTETVKPTKGVTEASHSSLTQPPTIAQEHSLSQPEQQTGPSVGPSLPSANDPTSLPEAPPSPSSYRALIQDLTLPSIPDFDIPPSPPGSPPAITHKKFEQFITLKKRGTHFNTKLESSTATRNPSLMDKLLGFVDVTGGSQYQTTLSRDLWDPSAFPDSAYRTRLRRAQDRIAKQRDSERTSGGRSSVEFVPSVGLSTGNKRRLDNDVD